MKKDNGLYVEILEVSGIKTALRGMRNPKNSWNRCDTEVDGFNNIIVGQNDMKLATMLIKGGTEHRKFLRQITVTLDVCMPRYWWSEADTYTFGTKNSCSTMHKLFAKDKTVTPKDFYNPLKGTEQEDLCEVIDRELERTCDKLNAIGDVYLKTGSKDMLRAAKALLPESYLQLRTWTTNYEELRNIAKQRKNHRLYKEWGLFREALKDLPYAEEFIF